MVQLLLIVVVVVVVVVLCKKNEGPESPQAMSLVTFLWPWVWESELSCPVNPRCSPSGRLVGTVEVESIIKNKRNL